MWAVNMLPVRALPNIGLIQKCQTRRRIVQGAKGKQTSAHSLWVAWTVGANSLGGRRQPVYVRHPAAESAQDVTQSPVQRGQSRLTFETRRWASPTAVMASPRPSPYARRSQALWPTRGSGPGFLGRRLHPHVREPAALASAAARRVSPPLVGQGRRQP